MNILFFDTETTGIPKNYKAPVSDSDNWPRMVQIAYILCDEMGNVIIEHEAIIKPVNYTIPDAAIEIHGITNEIANTEGKPLGCVLSDLLDAINDAEMVVGHNISFDINIVRAEIFRVDLVDILKGIPRICTMMKSTKYCELPGSYGYKWPKLKELHNKLFGESFEGAHDALEDIRAAKKCYFELRRLGVISEQDIENTINRPIIESF